MKSDIDELIPTQDYVLVKDTFLSGFMGMDIISLVALPVKDSIQEEIVFDNVENRSDWVYIDTQSGNDIKNDYKNDTRFNIKIKDKKNASRMYRKNGFT